MKKTCFCSSFYFFFIFIFFDWFCTMPRKRVAQGVLDNVPEIGENQRIVKMLMV